MEKLDPWKYFRTFYSANQTQNYLSKKYTHFPEGEKLAFQNSYTLIYYLEHGKKYYDQSVIAPYELQPVLLFYGMIQLMKAAILTVDPNYPETTQVLAHGVSTRKRKKVQYEFLFDEVKIQKNGLVTHFSEKMFTIKHLEGEKYKMGELMKRIPELHPSFYSLYNEKVAYPITKEQDLLYSLDNRILDNLHLSLDSFVHLVSEHAPLVINKSREEKAKIFLEIKKQLNPLFCSPIQFDLSKIQFKLPTERSMYSYLPELLVHYLILYNLSMICRYETDWWGELFHQYPSNDLPFITEFLEVTKQKVPFYIALLLQG
ncbi:YaaC family protein [Anaerobacillus sp. CMMVII]|uniref:YaaC family protein n=1 Tax=Anaerobacillus sp. CMMVII TaxID=2755588 RepID=UPI0021B739D2|nr:YaaC family protein [Anaerobacillus sp. CMMVII]MCT8136316.1 YaaC family protein [Anaerobacillus sp. CMMVII]